MISRETIDKPHRALLPIPEPAGAVAGMVRRPLGVAFRAPSLSRSRTNRASPLLTTRLAHRVAAAHLQGVGVPAVAPPPTIPVLPKEITVVALRPTVVQGRAVREGAGGIGKRSAISMSFFEYDVKSRSKNNRTRESSVHIDPSWQMLEEIEFHRLAKLRLEVDEPEEL